MTLASFNAAPEQEAVAAMLACCASRRFAAAMAAGRPYPSLAAAESAVETVFESLTWPDVLEAMDAHPRIGARVSGQSAAEQSGVADDSRAALRRATPRTRNASVTCSSSAPPGSAAPRCWPPWSKG